ncbi:PIR protein [Plasmodium vivax]|uniref:VIR protein n=1 Tax=Plasmodium vivax TaxID=5855 RepID=A0A565A4X9_PLAVI|nr:PIR protein [Plasmodium vivax]
MSCTSEYDFFNNIDKYITEAKNIENSIRDNTSDANCNNFSNQHKSLGNKEKLKSLCNRFAILNKLLNANKKENHNHCSFLNYWLNSELSQTWFSEDDCISFVYNGMESQLFSNPEYTSLNCKLHNINKDELNKMELLYNLYKNYGKLNTIIDSQPEQNKQEILTLSTQCCTDYNYVSYICNPGNNNNHQNFCEKLNDFKLKYEELYQKVDEKPSEISNNFIKLEECSNTKIITTAVTGTVVGLIPLLGVLYKFTPMGQVLRSKMGILNNDISNNDEEMIKMSLMEQENEPLKFQKGTYNIKYQSL